MPLNLFEKIYSKFLNKSYLNQKVSFSQCGEDLIVDFLFTWQLGIKIIAYMDIGANHPFRLNNTYLFYRRGCTGVNIEPDSSLFANLKKERPRDFNINKGIGFADKTEIADFYVMSLKALNTFSKEEAERINKIEGYSIKKVQRTELLNVNEVLAQHFSKKELDFLSIDVEGLDLKILRSVDFKKYKPKAICVETTEFNQKPEQKKESAIQNYLFENGYFAYADTFINTIFVRKELF